MSRFDYALPVTLGYEGSKSDNPKDPGGRTNQGITQRTYDAYTARKALAQRDVYLMSDAERNEIYLDDYWNPSRAEKLPAGLDLMVFDFAVNSGVSRAVTTLQTLLKVKADGVIGSETRNAIVGEDLGQLLLDYAQARLNFVKTLKGWSDFGKGWQRRIMGAKNGAQKDDVGIVDYALLQSETVGYVTAAKTKEFPTLPAPIGARDGEVNAKADPATVAVHRTAGGVGALSVAAGVTGQAIISTAQQVQPHIGDGLFGRLALGAFVLLLLGGGLLLAFSWYRKLKDTGLTLKELFA